MSGRAEGTRSSVFDVVSVQWIVSKVVYVAAEWPALLLGVAALVLQLVHYFQYDPLDGHNVEHRTPSTFRPARHYSTTPPCSSPNLRV